MYYAPMLRHWQLIRILIKTNHSCLRVGRHSWYQSHYGYNTLCMVLFSKIYGDDTLRYPYKDYSSLNR
jgi:hypothetical protein